jgi:transcriptional regulator with XRE-family HTH domain
MTPIKELRVKRDLDPRELAEAAGITIDEYYDLESIDDELHIAASVESIARVARALGVNPSTFYAGSSARAVSLDELVSLILQHTRETKKTLDEFEEEVGWDLAEALATPQKFLAFNAHGLRDVCAPLGINWLDVLDGLI